MPKIKLFKDCLWRDGSHNINQAEVRARRNSNSIHGHLRREGSSSQARRTRNGTQLFNFLFQGFDWEGLDSRSLDPPITPKVFLINSCFWDIWLLSLFQVQGPSDTSNFDKYPRDEVVPGDEVSGWDKEFWRSETSASQPFPITKQPQTFWVCPNFHSSVEGPCFMKRGYFQQISCRRDFLVRTSAFYIRGRTVDISVDKRMCTLDQIELHLRQDVIAQNCMKRPSCHLLRKAASIWKPRTGCVLCACRERFMRTSVLIPRSEVTKLCNGNPELTINVQLFF